MNNDEIIVIEYLYIKYIFVDLNNVSIFLYVYKRR